MKKLMKFAMAAAALSMAVFATSCDNGGKPDDNGGVKPEIEITGTGLKDVATTGGTGTLKITSNTDWKIAALPTDANWITIAEGDMTGNGNKDVSVTIAENTTTDTRAYAVSITAGTGDDAETKTYSITQATNDIDLPDLSGTYELVGLLHLPDGNGGETKHDAAFPFELLKVEGSLHKYKIVNFWGDKISLGTPPNTEPWRGIDEVIITAKNSQTLVISPSQCSHTIMKPEYTHWLNGAGNIASADWEAALDNETTDILDTYGEAAIEIGRDGSITITPRVWPDEYSNAYFLASAANVSNMKWVGYVWMTSAESWTRPGTSGMPAKAETRSDLPVFKPTRYIAPAAVTGLEVATVNF